MEENVEQRSTGNSSEKSASELLRDLSQQTGDLVRQEMELAKAELLEKGKAAGMGAGMFGGAGLVALYAVGALTAAAILALATAVDGWLAALIVAAAYGAIAGLLALTGKRKVQQATPPVPEQAIESTKEDVERTKQRAKEGKK
jgi:Putative Actinobacterial Holin-X, holin superfamily III